MQPLQLTDYDRIKPYLELGDYEGYNSNFVTMMMWNHEYHIEYEIHDHFLIMLHNYKGTKYFAMPFTSKDYYQEAMDYMIDYAKMNHFPFMIDCAVPAFVDEVKKLYKGRLIFERTRDFDDYVYEREALVSLSGKKMQKRRNHYNQFVKSYPDYEYRSLSLNDDFDLIIKCLAEWESDQSASESLTSEIYGILFLLSSNHLLNIKMGGIFINNELKAFTIASPLLHNTIQIHVEKADKSIRGLYPAIAKEFLEHEFTDYAYVNREEDMGLVGLRQSKMRLHPVHMVEKTRIFIDDTYIRIAKQEDEEAIRALWLDRFEDEDEQSTSFYFDHIYPHAKTYVLCFHDRIISAISVEQFVVNGYEDSYYVMGVLTDRSFEGQGFMKRLFNVVLNDYKEKRLYLTAYHPEVYKSLGFLPSHFMNKVKIDKKYYKTMETDYSLSHEVNAEVMSSLYDNYVSSCLEYRIRDIKSFELLLDRTRAFHQECVILMKDNQPSGYMIYEISNDNVDIVEIIYKREDIDAIVSCIVQSFKGKSINIIIDKEAYIEGKTSSYICMLCNKEDGHDHGIMINEVY